MISSIGWVISLTQHCVSCEIKNGIVVVEEGGKSIYTSICIIIM